MVELHMSTEQITEAAQVLMNHSQVIGRAPLNSETIWKCEGCGTVLGKVSEYYDGEHSLELDGLINKHVAEKLYGTTLVQDYLESSTASSHEKHAL